MCIHLFVCCMCIYMYIIFRAIYFQLGWVWLMNVVIAIPCIRISQTGIYFPQLFYLSCFLYIPFCAAASSGLWWPRQPLHGQHCVPWSQRRPKLRQHLAFLAGPRRSLGEQHVHPSEINQPVWVHFRLQLPREGNSQPIQHLRPRQQPSKRRVRRHLWQQ